MLEFYALSTFARLPVTLEFYALSTDRSASAVRRFLSRFLTRREPCTDEHWIPEHADVPCLVLNTEDQIFDYLERHANEPYGLYWNEAGSHRQAMAFYTRDGHVILGLADDPLDPALRLREIANFVGATHCLLTSEQRPPDTAAEFIELCSRFSSIAPPVSQASVNDKPIELRGTDLLLCHKVLNEVLHGVPVADFATRVGDERDARRLLDLTSSAMKSSRDDRGLTLQRADALLLRRAIEVILAEIDDSEFATRVGESKARVRQLLHVEEAL